MWNRHRESKNTKLYEIGSGMKLLFIFLSLKVFWHEERETQSFYADCFYIISSQPNQRAGPIAHKFVWPHPALLSLLSCSEAGTQLTAFSQIPKSSAHASGVWHHSHPLVSIPTWDFYFDISEWYILSVRVWTPALMLHLTNPCTKRKVLGLTKPKGKIYKTKSLGNYITIVYSQETDTYQARLTLCPCYANLYD